MNENMRVNVVTPDGIVYDHEATLVVAKTTGGEIGIMRNHAPLLAALAIDEVHVRRTDQDTHIDYVAVNGGIIEVRENVISIIADSAEREREIDVSRAERAKIRAERSIEAAKEAHNDSELKRATVALHRAVNRLKVSKHF